MNKSGVSSSRYNATTKPQLIVSAHTPLPVHDKSTCVWCHEWRTDSDLPNGMIANFNPAGRSSQHLMIISTDVAAAEKKKSLIRKIMQENNDSWLAFPLYFLTWYNALSDKICLCSDPPLQKCLSGEGDSRTLRAAQGHFSRADACCHGARDEERSFSPIYSCTGE